MSTLKVKSIITKNGSPFAITSPLTSISLIEADTISGNHNLFGTSSAVQHIISASLDFQKELFLDEGAEGFVGELVPVSLPISGTFRIGGGKEITGNEIITSSVEVTGPLTVNQTGTTVGTSILSGSLSFKTGSISATDVNIASSVITGSLINEKTLKVTGSFNAVKGSTIKVTGSLQTISEVLLNSTLVVSSSNALTLTGVWTAGGALSTARQAVGGIGYQTVGLGFGGFNGAGLNITEEYNGFVWSGGGNLPAVKWGAGGVGRQTSGYSIGGQGSGVSCATTETYDGSVWSVGSSLNTPRSLPGTSGTPTAALAALGYEYGGTPVSPVTVEEYDGTSWSFTANSSVGRTGPSAAGKQNDTILFGGITVSIDYCTLTEEYNGLAWTTANSMITPRARAASAGIQNSALASGGQTTGNGYVSADEFYNGVTWSVGSTVITPRAQVGGAGTAACALTFGGTNGSAVTCTEELALTKTCITAPILSSAEGSLSFPGLANMKYLKDDKEAQDAFIPVGGLYLRGLDIKIRRT